MNQIIQKTIKNLLIREAAGVSFDARVWTPILIDALNNLPKGEKRVIIDCQDYPEQHKKFSADYVVLDLNDWTNGYLDETSGYDKDGNYVIHIMVLEQFVGHPYMKTILNHEGKHAYQDWQRRSKGYEGIFATKEVKELYTGDFIKVVKDKIDVGPFFKDILTKYYLLTDLELNAFMENVYDRDRINNYKMMVSQLKNYDASRSIYHENPGKLEKNWQTLKSLDIPFVKKYKSYTDFLNKSTEYFRKRSQEILKKINKLEYTHGLNEGLIKENQVICNLVAPKSKNGDYISNEEALKFIDKIEFQGNKEIQDQNILKQFNQTISKFKKDIGYLDVNNDTVDTYIHKLRTLLNC